MGSGGAGWGPARTKMLTAPSIDRMQRFATLYDAIDSTTSTNAKVAAMARYFSEAPPADAAWAVFFLTGRRLKRLLPYAAIHDWTIAATGLPSWIIEESYSVVGDGAETAALVLDQLPIVENTAPLPLAAWVEERILSLRTMDPDTQRARVTAWWAPLDRLQRFVLLKLITGEFRVGVSQTLVVRALAQASGLAGRHGGGPADGRLDADRRLVRIAQLARSPPMSTSRGRIPSSWRHRSKRTCPRSAIPRTGCSNGSGTGSARSW